MMSVLLVDDDVNFRRSLAIGLETSGYHVYEASSGMEALEFLQSPKKKENPVDGVVIDARMPGLDGFWLADQISAKYPSLRLVILSAHAYPTETSQYKILTKPVGIPVLVEALKPNVPLSSQD